MPNDSKQVSAQADRRPLWNSLEVAKLIVSTATPLALFGLGVVVTLQAQGRDDTIRRESLEIARYSKVIEKRGELWARLGPKLTYAHVEIMRSRAYETDYDRVLQTLTSARTDVLTFRYYFSEDFSRAFEAYADAAWDYVNDLKKYRSVMPKYGTGNDPEELREVTATYDKLKVVLAKELDIVRAAPER